MMALFRLLFNLLRKEELKFFALIRKQPRRNLLIALDALITMSLVFGGVAYASQSSKTAMSNELKHIGALPMTTSEFVAHVHADGGGEYWLGGITGYGITLDERQKNVRTLSYTRNGAKSKDLNGENISVVTFRGSRDTEGLHRYSPRMELSTYVTASGRVVQFNEASMLYEVVSMTGSLTEVSIHYPKAQNLKTFMDNAMALQIAE